MAVLSNPIDNDNIVARFEDYVRAAANSGIVWHSANLPFPEAWAIFDAAGGKTPEISGTDLTSPISASNVFNVLLAETRRYTRCRYLRAVRVVDGGGDEPGPPGVNFDQTQKAHLAWNYEVTVNATQNILPGTAVDDGTLETQLDSLRNAYYDGQNTVAYMEVHVCHSSCHQSCHGNRGRR